jgi:hypothetical protein
MSDRLAVDPPRKAPHSTTTPSRSGGSSSSFTAIARWAFGEVPVNTRRLVHHSRQASRALRGHDMP